MAKVEKGAKGGSLTVLGRKGKVGTFSYMDDDSKENNPRLRMELR